MRVQRRKNRIANENGRDDVEMRVAVLEAGRSAKREAFVGDLKQRVRIPWHFAENRSLCRYYSGHLLKDIRARRRRDRPGGITRKTKCLPYNCRAVDIEATNEKRHIHELVII